MLVRRQPYIAFTPTGSWVANTTYSGGYRYDPAAGTLDLNVSIALSGPPNATALALNLPLGLQVEFSRLPSLTGRCLVGIGTYIDSGVNWYSLMVAADSGQPGVVYPINCATSGGLVLAGAQFTNVVPITWTVSDIIDCHVRGLPVVGP